MKQAIAWALAALVAAGAAHGAIMSGRVTTAGGDGIAATITILSGSLGADVIVHETEEDGTFSIEVPAGAIAAAASATDYSSHEIDLSNGVPRNLRFTLRELGFFEGTVTDSRGRVVEGANVRIRNIDYRRRIYIDRYSTDVSDADGKFVIAVPSSGSDRFVADVAADGWVPQSSRVLGRGSVGSTGAGEQAFESVRISLESRGARVSGTVTSPSGAAARGVTVLVNARVRHANTGAGPGGDPGFSYGERVRARVKTDSRGRYEVSGLPFGSLAVVAIKRGVVIPVQRFTTSDGDSVTADFIVPD